jgi:hypothetical protein
VFGAFIGTVNVVLIPPLFVTPELYALGSSTLNRVQIERVLAAVTLKYVPFKRKVWIIRFVSPSPLKNISDHQ